MPIFVYYSRRRAHYRELLVGYMYQVPVIIAASLQPPCSNTFSPTPPRAAVRLWINWRHSKDPASRSEERMRRTWRHECVAHACTRARRARLGWGGLQLQPVRWWRQWQRIRGGGHVRAPKFKFRRGHGHGTPARALPHGRTSAKLELGGDGRLSPSPSPSPRWRWEIQNPS